MSLFGKKPAVSEDKTLLCVRDGTRMEKLTREGVTIDRCKECGGLWFDASELGRVAHDREIEKLAARVTEFADPSPFACPRCGGKCWASHVSEVEVDTCEKCHGLWLDGGELEEAKREIATERLLAEGGVGFRVFCARL